MRGHVRAVAAGGHRRRRADGLRALLADRFVRVLSLTSGLVTLCAAMMNVGELVLAQRRPRRGGDRLRAARPAPTASASSAARCCAAHSETRPAFFAGLGGVAAGMLGTALAPGARVRAGHVRVHRRGQRPVLREQDARCCTRSCRSTCTAARSACSTRSTPGASALAVLAGGALTTFLGGRALFAVAGVLLLVVCGLTALLLTRQPRRALVTSPAPA